MSSRVQANFAQSSTDRSRSSPGNYIVYNISSNSLGHTCMSASMSGMGLEQVTCGACLCLRISATSLIHPSISLGFLSAQWMACTFQLPYFFLVMNSLSIRSALALLVWLRAGSSRVTRPKVSCLLSALSIFKNASTSPTAQMYSGINGFSFDSISICSGWKRFMCLNKSFISYDTIKYSQS